MKKLQILFLAIAISAGIGISTETIYTQVKAAPVVSTPAAPQAQYLTVNPLELVSNPYKFSKRNIQFKAKFDKFSTLGLDYPAALRPHEKYISILIQRPDITNHNIPLSELKIFLTKEVAEKNIDLSAGDEIQLKGKIFSTALGDPWMDVDDIKIINKINKEEKKK